MSAAGRRIAALWLATALGCALFSAPAVAASPSEVKVPVGAEPDGTAVSLDATVFSPGSGKHPAVILAHGFGGTKADLTAQADRLAARGYLVLTYSARGFGASGGRIHLNDPDFEIADARRLIDLLATRDDVELDAPGDPKVAVMGGSYGGALALMTAATDPRVNTDVAAITWNDLATAFFPQSAQGATAPGPFKQLWGSRFFSGTLVTGESVNPTCGRFDPSLCARFKATAETGQATPELLKVLHRNSPAPSLSRLTAPTFLIQGEADSLFGLDQSDATATTLLRQGRTVAVRWSSGGHDASPAQTSQDEDAAIDWLATHLPNPLNPKGSAVAPFTFAMPRERSSSPQQYATVDSYPTGGDLKRTTVALQNRTGQILTPPGGAPASITSVPGVGAFSGVGGLPTYALAALPGQSVAFDTDPVPTATLVTGAPEVSLTVTSTGPTVTLFASLWRVQGSANISQPRPLVAPLTMTVKPGVPQRVTVRLPSNSYQLGAGSTWRVLITSTDSGFANQRQTRVDRVTLADPKLLLPQAVNPQISRNTARDTESWGVGAAILGLLALIGGWVLINRRRHPHPVRDDLRETPLVVEHLVKTYKDGHRAVDDVSWRAERGQVVGLLGPNGAGKTTTIRMLLGLITPDSGSVHVLGQPIRAGAPVLGSVGALVEGPGFLPHLSGMANLKAYWAATGRPEEEAGFAEAIEVAALGGALDRPVRTYSQGMRQRLGIAQAMLGRPELLFLDEPTNGLDPPQIAAMRPILQAYAATGRTVVVSSHLLGEVEQTCSHVVVMHAGRVITSGPVEALVASSDTTVLTLPPGSDVEQAATLLRGQPGITAVETIDEPARITVVAELPRSQVIRLAVDNGIDVNEVGGRRHLEEVFLGVIADASSDPTPGRSLNERLRQVRAR